MAASNEKTSAFTSGMERKLIPTRICDAPGELVFKAWTDSKHMEQWWGPHGFANPVCEMDVRPGGSYRIHMRGPNESCIRPRASVGGGARASGLHRCRRRQRG